MRLRCFIGWHDWGYTREPGAYDAFPAPDDREWIAPRRLCLHCGLRQKWLPGYGGSELGCWLTYPKAVHERSNQATVRNPLLALEAAQSVVSLPPEARAALKGLLLAIRADAQARAQECWRKHKAPMACYWKAVAVYAGHAARLCRDGPTAGIAQ